MYVDKPFLDFAIRELGEAFQISAGSFLDVHNAAGQSIRERIWDKSLWLIRKSAVKSLQGEVNIYY